MTASAKNDVNITIDNVEHTLTNDEKQNGVMFIVIEKKVDGDWYPVTGNALDGWTVYGNNTTASIAQAGKETNAIFTISTSGAYEAEVENLPGRIQDYEYFAGESGTYRAAYYYTSASTLDNANESNTFAISNSDEFYREFSARVYVSNVVNRVLVQKTDESGNAVNGAQMALFSADYVDVAEDGTATLKQGVTANDALQTATTCTLTEETDSINLDGAAIFTDLQSGTYYVAEVDAPNGYAVNGTLAKVVVDDTGVYADAGAEGDGVTVTRGVGRIVRSMIQFATNDDIDATLHNIEATPQLGTQGVDGALNWQNNENAPVQHLQYDDDGDSVLDYALKEGSEAYTVDEGMPRMTVKQCSTHPSEPSQDVLSYDLTNLFTGVTIVHIADEQVGSLDVTKEVKGDGADENATFNFTVTFTHAAADGGDATPLKQDEADVAGMQLAVDAGDADDVTVSNNGEVTFELKGGEIAHFTNVPAGVNYNVVENTASGYTTSYDDKESGTIVFNETMSTTVTNTWHSSVVIGDDEADLQVTKEVTGAPALSEFGFELKLTSDNVSNVQVVTGDTAEAFPTDGIKVSTNNLFNENSNTGIEGSETIDFGDLSFTAEDVYTFEVTETTTTEAGGWTYGSGSGSVITVTVTDKDQDGQLEATTVVEKDGEQVDTNNPTITNSYEPDEVTTTDDTSVNTNILVTKKVTGAQATEAFKFSLNLAEGQSGDNVYEGSGDSKTPFDGVEVTTSDNIGDGATETKAFSGVTFTAAGDYKFVIDETTTTEPHGWSYDDSTHEITVHVADQNGQLVITKIDGNNPTFTNSYKADPVDIGSDSGNAGIQVQKTLTGRDWQTGDTFTFTLTAQDNAPMPADVVEGSKSVTITNETDKTLDFGQITYDTEGTYTYKVKETVPTEGALGGITYDSHEVTVTVTVTDTDHDGKLDVPTVSYNNSDGTTEADKSLTNAAAFTNTYGTVPGTEEKVDTEATFGLTKQLTGIDWGDRKFTFSITPTGETPAPVDSEGNKITQVTVSAPSDGDTANVDFGTFVYKATGIYTYTIKEVVPEGATGNVYNGITYDTHEVTVTVNITDDLAGGFAHSVLITNGDTKFTNTYGTELNYNAAGGLQIEKTLIDHAIADDQFEFTITAQNDASKALLGNQDFKVLQTKASTDLDEQGNGVATLQVFDDVVFTHTHDQGDAPEYEFIIFENKGGDTNAGYTNDETQYTVTINVEDDGAGLLEVITHVVGCDMDQTYTSTNQGQQQTAIVPFTNTYEAMGTLGGEGAVKINATKTTTGRDMVAGEYNFTVTATNDNNEVKEYATGTNVAAADGVAGAVNFSAINYTKTSLNDDVQAGYADYDLIDGKDTYTYVYTVAEDTNGLASEGVTATASSFQITVVVTDNNDGTLSAQVAQYPDGSNSALAFANTYNTNSVDMTFVGAKQIDNGGWTDAPTLAQIAGEYTFTLSGVEEGTDNPAPLPADPTATNDATGNITFDPITYTLDNVFGAAETTDNETTEGVEAETTNENEGVETYAGGERSKTFTYTIEESGSVDGIQNDSAKTFTVTVTDDGSGKLTVDADQGTGALFTFTNTYNVLEKSSSPTDGSLTLNKVLTGRDMAAGEFGFVMTGTSENAQGMSATGTNTAAVDGEAGSVTLSAITFQEPGTYEFQISEANGNLGGVDYDSATLKAVAEVSSDGKGNMEIDWTIYNADGTEISDYTYNNTYTASPTSVILGGTKVLDGRTLADGEFNFELRDADGNVLQTVANNAEGGIVFDKITYDAEGTYEYTISEIAGDAEGITYDDTTYTAKVVVTDDGQGSFKVSQLTYNDGVEFPLFTNTYTEPSAGGESDEGPIEYLTKTSDTWLPALFAVIAAMAAAVGGFAAYRMKRSNGRR
ncbi:MAG TPA: SpaA isopeptide-forming pilin-related protein [Eggerthellaceae bacterium]|nr:SpaA isopeptide-forming pilin-related protein [Eggerthellaceae bacterium]